MPTAPRRPHSRRRGWLYAVLVGGLILATVWVVGRARAPAGTALPPPYLVITVRQGSFQGEVAATGTIAPRALATVETPVAGTLTRLDVQVGQGVSAGTAVAALANGTVLTTPIAGTVVSIPVSTGAYLTTGETVATVADLSVLYADLNVPEGTVREVAPGQSVTLTLPALPGRRFSGQVTEVGRQGTPDANGTVEFPVTVRLDRAFGLLLGMTASATVHTGRKPSALYIPSAAVQVLNGKTVVLAPVRPVVFSRARPSGFWAFLLGAPPSPAPRVVPRTVVVRVGLTNLTETQIVQGLRAGQQVLVANPAAGSQGGVGFGGS